MDFQDVGQSDYLGFLIKTILVIFYLQVTPMLPTKFQLAFRFRRSGHGGHLGFPILAILIYKSTRCFLASFKLSGLSVQEKK